MTTEEIRQELTTAFMNNPAAAQLFNFAQGANFDNTFSRAGLVSIMFYVVAYVIALKENNLDLWKSEITALADHTRYGTWRWWVSACRAFQYGDTTEVIEGKVAYPVIDTDKQIVTGVAIVEDPSSQAIIIYVAKGAVGAFQPLDPDELDNFEAYVAKIKPLGVNVQVVSGAADTLVFNIVVTYNSTTTSTELWAKIDDVITEYLAYGVEFGGTVYRSRILAEIMGIEGVLDVPTLEMLVQGSNVPLQEITPAYGHAIYDRNASTKTLNYNPYVDR